MGAERDVDPRPVFTAASQPFSRDACIAAGKTATPDWLRVLATLPPAGKPLARPCATLATGEAAYAYGVGMGLVHSRTGTVPCYHVHVMQAAVWACVSGEAPPSRTYPFSVLVTCHLPRCLLVSAVWEMHRRSRRLGRLTGYGLDSLQKPSSASPQCRRQTDRQHVTPDRLGWRGKRGENNTIILRSTHSHGQPEECDRWRGEQAGRLNRGGRRAVDLT